ncbi:MAG: hypothetical protein RL299_255 [Pseudomonadota bacterium]|jgi:hypothetical protein
MSENTEAAAAPGPMAGLAITAIIVVLLVAWIAIWIGLLKMSDTTLVGAFMFLWYWANNEQLQFNRLVPAMAGSLVGIGIAWFLWYGPAAYGSAGLIGSLAVLIAALYLDVTKMVPIAVNTATMLFLTLAAAPLVQLQVDWVELVKSTVLGGLFFAAAVYGLQKLAARFAPGS